MVGPPPPMSFRDPIVFHLVGPWLLDFSLGFSFGVQGREEGMPGGSQVRWQVQFLEVRSQHYLSPLSIGHNAGMDPHVAVTELES